MENIITCNVAHLSRERKATKSKYFARMCPTSLNALSHIQLPSEQTIVKNFMFV